jgi:hypothetical protein
MTTTKTFNKYFLASDILKDCKFTAVDNLCVFAGQDLPPKTNVQVCSTGYPVQKYSNPSEVKHVWKGRRAKIISPRVMRFAHEDLSDGEYYFVQLEDSSPYLMEKKYFTIL